MFLTNCRYNSTHCIFLKLSTKNMHRYYWKVKSPKTTPCINPFFVTKNCKAKANSSKISNYKTRNQSRKLQKLKQNTQTLLLDL